VTRAKLRAGYEKVYSFYHPEIDEAVTTLVEKIADEPTDLTFGGWLGTLSVCMLCTPDITSKEVAPLGSTIETAIAAVTKSHTGKMARVEMAAAGVANLLDCGGVSISDRTFREVTTWLPRIVAKRNDLDTTTYWNKGFAALALGDQATYLQYCDKPLQLEPGATYEHNLRGFITMLAAAVETKASVSAVLPAYNEVLDLYATFQSASTLDEYSLFWIARIVHHRLGGLPVRKVAAKLHDDLWQS
jgi:hypothetical protein